MSCFVSTSFPTCLRPFFGDYAVLAALISDAWNRSDAEKVAAATGNISQVVSGDFGHIPAAEPKCRPLL